MPTYHPYRSDFAEKARTHCRLGAAPEDLADLFGVDVVTIFRWQITIPSFARALKHGREEADDMVEQALFRKAIGCSHPAVKIFIDTKTREPKFESYIEHHPPDTAACQFWLKHRRPESWREPRDAFDLDAAMAGDAIPVEADEPGPDKPIL
ncbi:helix-turn-helix domain-containing protein [Methylovirgula sp. 4M-Z18]|uniref:helix-turn-helix domain-containing protein n=1 Tax=Methylovirgula sp. 4M-Z18 TaxID=2293567 RepID=UPI000E2F5D05|nr:helix-turn-helix domain-containing protein [Methylovirgula sp. 4M-Z18]RFB80002.1 helix-turn-helix domain-containing protein [Methylovirgula sp. 4M-Z18]